MSAAESSRGGRTWAIAALAAVLLLGVCTAVVVLWLRHRTHAPRYPRRSGPPVHVTLVNLGMPAGAGDVAVLQRRLERAGYGPEVRRADPRTIELTLYGLPPDNAAASYELAPLLLRRELHLNFVAADQSGLEVPAGGSTFPGVGEHVASVSVGEDTAHVPRRLDYRMYAAPSAAALAPVLAALPPRRDRVPAIECQPARGPSEPAFCWAWLLETPGIIANEDVAHAEVRRMEDRNEPVVFLTLTPDAARRFGDATEQNLRRQLAIVVDGDILAMPVVQTPIRNGQMQITMGGIGRAAEREAEARRLAEALDSGMLNGRWRLDSVRAGP